MSEQRRVVTSFPYLLPLDPQRRNEMKMNYYNLKKIHWVTPTECYDLLIPVRRW